MLSVDEVFLSLSLLIRNETKKLDEVLFKSLEDSLVVFSCAYVLFKASHALGNIVSGELAAIHIVVVYVSHTELGLKSHLSGKKLNKLCKDVFMIRECGIIYEHNAIGIFLNCWPAFFTAKVSGNVP